eukprot:3018668-Pleurochrysis_carterae.AAC.1
MRLTLRVHFHIPVPIPVLVRLRIQSHVHLLVSVACCVFRVPGGRALSSAASTPHRPRRCAMRAVRAA